MHEKQIVSLMSSSNSINGPDALSRGEPGFHHLDISIDNIDEDGENMINFESPAHNFEGFNYIIDLWLIVNGTKTFLSLLFVFLFSCEAQTFNKESDSYDKR
jgi:hypothetical protein